MDQRCEADRHPPDCVADHLLTYKSMSFRFQRPIRRGPGEPSFPNCGQNVQRYAQEFTYVEAFTGLIMAYGYRYDSVSAVALLAFRRGFHIY